MNTRATIAPGENKHVTDHAARFGVHPIIIRILHARGYDTAEAIDNFLHADLADLHSPFLFRGMYHAVERIRKAILGRERIGIFADSDLDGITSMAVIYNLLSRMKIDPFLRYLKDEENYGITNGIVDEFKDNGVSLMITVDSGIRDISEIAYARSLGIDVIVTDHHEQDRDLPDAIVINPKIQDSPYPFKHLAGVGVAFKLCQAILMSYLQSFKKRFLLVEENRGRFTVSEIRDCIIGAIEFDLSFDDLQTRINRIGIDDFILVHDNEAAKMMKNEYPAKRIMAYIEFATGIIGTRDEDIESISRSLSLKRTLFAHDIDLLNKIFMEIQFTGSEKVMDYIESVIGLVAIGSIADVIPLIGENRILVKAGIENLGRTTHRALSMVTHGEKIDSRFIGWTMAPLLNTPGRLGKTDLTVDFFIAKDKKKLEQVLSEIIELNEGRRLFVKKFCGSIWENIENSPQPSQGRIIHIKTDRIPEGYAGLIANRIADMAGQPVIVTVLPGKNGIVKGSGRSKGGSLFFSHFEKYSDRFERIGGHENAFGFTVRVELVDEIIGLIEQSIGEDSVARDAVQIDCELDVSCINSKFINDLQTLEPFGQGNGEPVFMARKLKFESFQQFGNNHGKYLISDYDSLTAIGWSMGEKMKNYFESGKPLDLVFRLENNYFNGKVTPRMIILDIIA